MGFNSGLKGLKPAKELRYSLHRRYFVLHSRTG